MRFEKCPVNNCLEQAVSERLILTNPAKGCKLPKMEKREMKILPEEQIGAYLAEAERRGLLVVSTPKTQNSIRTLAIPQHAVDLLIAEYEKQHLYVPAAQNRHTFATLSLGAGMDVKTLSAIIGHNSVFTTLNVYTHVTDTMRAQAAVTIDRAITGSTAR